MEELETEVIEVEEEVSEAAENEEAAEAKSFDEMSDDERLELSDDDLVAALDKEEESAESGSSTEKKDEEKEDAESTDEEGKASEYDKIANMSEEQFQELPKEKKGVFFEMRSERNKRQDMERELDKERAIHEGQMKVIENLKGLRGTEGDQSQKFANEYEKAMADIEAKAIAYEEESGEEYRLTLKDQRLLNSAQKTDADTARQENEATQAKEQQVRTVQVFQERIEAGIKSMKEAGHDDFDHVYKTLIEPMVNPDIAKDSDLARANAQVLINLAMKGKNPAEYAYNHLARISPEGQKYFQEKSQKKINKQDLVNGGKTTTKTSAHTEGARSTNGKTKIDMSTLNNNFEYWAGKLTDEQFTKVVSGGEVHL